MIQARIAVALIFIGITIVFCSAEKHEGKIYDSSNETCCDGSVHKLSNGGGGYVNYGWWNSGCCGNKQVNRTEELCCNRTTVHKLPDKSGAWSCCGTEMYNRNESTCCWKSSTIIPLNDEQRAIVRNNSRYSYRIACCDKTAYDTKTQYCHNSTQIKEKDERKTSFCNEEPYDYHKQLCCWEDNYKIIDRIDETATTHAPSAKSQQNKKAKESDNKDTKSAGQGLMVAQNQRYVMYNPQSCCGGKAYYTTGASCCKGQIKKHPEQVAAKSKDDKSTTPRPTASYQCCGSDLIDHNTHICCNSTKYRIKTNENGHHHISCCGNKPYNTTKNTCCGEKTFKIPEVFENGTYNEASQCCNDKPLKNPEKEMCCNNTVVAKPKYQHASCCGSEAYDHNQKACCADTFTIDKDPKSENNETQYCCTKDEVQSRRQHQYNRKHYGHGSIH